MHGYRVEKSPLAQLPVAMEEKKAECTMQDMTDDALLAALALDDKQAFRELTTRYLDKICRLAYRMLNNRQDAEDVAQEVFVSVWNNRKGWQSGTATFSTWIYRVAVNRSIDFRRKRKVVNIELTEELVESNDVRADDMVSARQMQVMLLSCLKELPEKQMLAMLYFYYEEMEIHEICAKLDATEDSVRSLLKRGRASMKDIVSSRMNNEAGQLYAIAPYLKG